MSVSPRFKKIVNHLFDTSKTHSSNPRRAMTTKTESTFLHHEGCPNCGSSDNVGVYSDGHKFCFGCRHFWAPNKSSPIIKYHRAANDKNVDLPRDATRVIPMMCSDWLFKYGITAQETYENNIMYSHIMNRLIFPVFGNNSSDVLFWQGRYFGPESDRPKYLTAGKSEDVLDIKVPKVNSGLLILVEDKVSMIKVGRVFNTCCLYGSTISERRASRLAQLYSHLTIWLDYDKIQEAYKYQKKHMSFFDEVNVVNTAKDPKCYSVNEIKELVSQAG